MVEITKSGVEQAGIDVDLFLLALRCAALYEWSVQDLYSATFTAIEDLDLSNVLLQARSDHSRHHEMLLPLIKNLGGRIQSGRGFEPLLGEVSAFDELASRLRSVGITTVVPHSTAPGRQFSSIEVVAPVRRTPTGEEDSLLQLYGIITQLNAGRIRAIDDLIGSIVQDERNHQRAFRQIFLDRNTLSSLEKLSAANDPTLRDLEKHTVSISHLERLAEDVHGYLIPMSLGIQTDDLRLRRFVSVRVYVSRYDEEVVDNIPKAALRFAETLGFRVSQEWEVEHASWFKRWAGRTKEIMTLPEVSERLKKAERAIELATLHKHQADVDKTQADAAAVLVEALQQTPEAIVQIGSLLIVKLPNLAGTEQIVARSLTQRELALLEENPALLKNPTALLHSLQAGGADSFEPEQPRVSEGRNSQEPPARPE